VLPYLDLDTVRWLLGQDDETLVKLLGGGRQEAAEPPQADWLMRIKNTVYDVFMSESFANRGYFDQTAVVEAFEAFIKRPNSSAAAVFWRILNVELWCREFLDAAQPTPEIRIKTDLEANEGKALDLVLPDGGSVRRYPLRTELFLADEDLTARVVSRVSEFFDTLSGAEDQDHQVATTGRWYLFISEKIVAITQGRSMFVWDIKVSWAARVLSRFVVRTPTGIGLGSPFTMQLAIGEAGLPRILFASAGSVVGKVMGKRGVFYDLVGNNVRAIDGPTEYSAYPSNVSAKLPPKDPDKVAAELTAAIRPILPERYASTFAGTVVMDANDLGRNALGQDVPGEPRRYEEMFADNPLGQGSQQTPLAIVFERP
jgi:asparagine synthase (glutamine-hydrolysing)